MTIRSYKVKLKPTPEQEAIMLQFAGCSRFIYNWTIAFQQTRHKNGERFLPAKGMSKYVTELKHQEQYKWLNDCDSVSIVVAYTDACNAFNNFFREIKKGNKNQGYPKFKSKNKTKPSFAPNYQRVKFLEDTVKIAKIGEIKLCRKNYVPIVQKYSNPRITFNGLEWYISVGVDEIIYPICEKEDKKDIIGIDLGIKDTAILSNGIVYNNINKTDEIRKLEKKLKRLQRQSSRKYDMLKEDKCFKKNEKPIKTKNIIKIEKEINKIHKKLYNIRNYYNHKITSDIIKMNPEAICIEDLNIKGMMKNKHISKSLQEQCLNEIERQLKYKCEWNDIRLIEADRWFPSSKLCSNCLTKKTDLKLNDRTYKCINPECNLIIDRDLNASINLKNYEKIITLNK